MNWMEVSGQPYTPATLASPPGKGHRYPLDRMLGGPLSRSGRCDVEMKSMPLLGIELGSSSP